MSAYEANSCTFILLACLDTKLTKKNALIIRNPDKHFNPYWPSNKWATVSTAII